MWHGASQALGVGDLRFHTVPGVQERLLHRCAQKIQLLLEARNSGGWQVGYQVLQHSVQPANDLNTVGAIASDLRDRQEHKILPVRRAVDHPNLTGPIAEHPRTQVALAHLLEEKLELVDGQYPGSRVVDGCGEGLISNIHDDAKG